jgi:hypothetical protein
MLWTRSTCRFSAFPQGKLVAEAAEGLIIDGGGEATLAVIRKPSHRSLTFVHSSKQRWRNKAQNCRSSHSGRFLPQIKLPVISAKKTPIMGRGQLTPGSTGFKLPVNNGDILENHASITPSHPCPHQVSIKLHQTPSNSISTLSGRPILLVKSFAKATSALDTILPDITVTDPSASSAKGDPGQRCHSPQSRQEARGKFNLKQLLHQIFKSQTELSFGVSTTP